MAIKRKIMKKISSKLRRKNKTPLNKFTKSKRQNKKRKYKTKRRSQKGGVENECGICGEISDKLMTVSCGHKFHRGEITLWCDTISPRVCTCPVCRKEIIHPDYKRPMTPLPPPTK